MTRTPVPTHSARMLAASALTAHLVAEYRLPGRVTRPATDPVSSRWPPDRVSAGSTARAVSAGPEHVRGHQPMPVARGQATPAQERGRRGPARVGEHHVQLAQRAGHLADQGEQLIPVGYVAADGQGPGGPPSSAASVRSGPGLRPVSATR